MADLKPRPSLRADHLSAALEQKLENEAGILDLLVSSLSRGQSQEENFEKLHQAAQRDDRLAELAFAYERLSKDKKLKALSPAAQATVLGQAGTFFADVFGDADGAEGYLQKALAALPTDATAFAKLEQLLTARGLNDKLGDLYHSQASVRGDKAEQIRLYKRAAELAGEDAERALRAQQEVARLDPNDAEARAALEDLFERTGRMLDLCKLLEQTLAAGPSPDDARALRNRLLSLYAGMLDEIERALPHVEEILREDPGHEAARFIGEELLGRKPLAGRVASVLAAAYEHIGEPSEAARMLGIEIESLRGPKKLEAQKKLSRLTLEQLGDLEKAFALDEAIVPLDPADAEVRTRFVKLASALDKQAEATKALARAASAAKEAGARAQINADLGDLYREAGDARKARASYQSVIDAKADDEATLRAARALVNICLELDEPRALAGVYAKLAEIEPDEEAKIAATLALARLAEGGLQDPQIAIAAYQKLIGTSADAEAEAALEQLYEKADAHAELVALLDRKAAREPTAAETKGWSFRAAQLRSTKLGDRAAALEAWRAYLKTHGPSRESLGHLVPLLEHERRWEELASALANEAELTPEAERAPVLARIGQLRLARLADPVGALEAHRAALAIDPTEKSSRQALDRLLSAGDLRLRAADVLEPIARAEGSASSLVRVLEARALLAEESDARLRALEEAAELAQRGLRDPKRAVDLASRGLQEALGAAPGEVASWVERVEKAAAHEAPRRASALREALGDRVVTSPATALLARRAGEALVEAGDTTTGLEILRRALAFEPSSAELLHRIDGLLRDRGSPAERLALYREALERTTDRARRREILHAMGSLQRKELGTPTAAITTYRRARLDDPADRVALDALLEILHEQGSWKELNTELTGAVERTTGEEQAGLRRRAAELATTHGWLDQAALHYAALLAGPSPSEAVLAGADKVAKARGDHELHRAVLERRVELATDAAARSGWLEQLGELGAHEIGDVELARGSFQRAGEEAEAGGDLPRATALYEKALLVAPSDRDLAKKLLELHRAQEAWDRIPPVYAVLLRTAGDATEAGELVLAFEEPARRAGALHRFLTEVEGVLGREGITDETRARTSSARARVLGEMPDRFGDAVSAYRSLLERGDDPRGEEAAALDALLRSRGAEAAEERRWLFGFRAGNAGEADRVAALLAWALAEENELGDSARATEIYGRVATLDGGNAAALAAQARLLRARGDFAGTAEILARLRDLSEGAARDAHSLELATLLFDHLGRPVDAVEAARVVLETSPTEPAALALIERALGHEGARAAAAALLENAADAAADIETFATLMERLLATPVDAEGLSDARRRWFDRLLDREDLPADRALAVALRAAAESPFDGASWDRAEQLARKLQAAPRVAAAYRRELGVAAVRSAGSARPLPPTDVEPDGKAPEALRGRDADQIEDLGRRAIEYHEEWFDEPETVVALLHRVFELAPSSTWAFERLKLVFNLGERWDELFSLYDAAVATVTDSDTRRELLEDAALAAKDLAADSGRAMGYLEKLLAERPDARVRQSLERLYDKHGRHRQLIDLLSGEVASLPLDAAQRTRSRIALLWLDGVGDPAPAVEVLDAMIQAEPGRADALDLLERVMQKPAPEEGPLRAAQRRAAALLKGRYEASGRPVDLVRVLELELDGVTDPVERIERLRVIVGIRKDQLADDAGAFEGVGALLQLEPSSNEHRAELVRLAEKLDRPRDLARMLVRAAASATGSTRLELPAQAADIYHERLGETARAAELYRAVLAQAGDEPEWALAAARKLDGFLEGNAAAPAEERCEILERLAELEPEASARREARQRLSRLALESGDAERAIRAFRAAIAENPGDDEAREGLATALEKGERWAELVEVLEQKLEKNPGAPRADRVRVARLLEEKLGDGERAIAAWQGIRKDLGPDDESTDTLAELLSKAHRDGELGDLLESAAASAEDPERAAALFVRLGDLHRLRTGKLEDAAAAYDLAFERSATSQGARSGFEALLAGLDATDPSDATSKATLRATVGSLVKAYRAADDFEGQIRLLEPRLATTEGEVDRIALLLETAVTAERRANDPARAFDLTLRAFRLSPSEELASEVTRLAELGSRWSHVAAALEADLDARADLPPTVARDLWWLVAEWRRDHKNDPAGAETALDRALARDPKCAPLLTALADLQRRAPSLRLVTTLLRLAEIEADPGKELDLYGEAVEIAEGPVGDAALAKTLAERLLDAATARWTAGTEVSAARFGSPREAASWALDALVRLVHREDPKVVADLYLRGARLPFDAGERRRLRLRAAEVSARDESAAIYRELFEEDPSDPLVSDRLTALLLELGRGDELVGLRERQIAVAKTPERKADLRFDLARLLAEKGDRARAIEVLRENAAQRPPHAPSLDRLAELLAEAGLFTELCALHEERAAQGEKAGDQTAAVDHWLAAAELSEHKLSDTGRAIADHRRAAALGAASSAEALARLLLSRGDYAAAAEALEKVCERASPETLAEPALRLVDAYLAAGKAATARARLEKLTALAKDAGRLRARLATLYREGREWGSLARLLAEDARAITEPAARAVRLREAAELHLERQGDPSAAIPLLDEAASLSPDDVSVRLKLASARRATGDLERASASLQEMLAAYGSRKPKDRALVHYELGRVELTRGDKKKALAELDAALRIDPAHPEILNLQARLALEEGQLDRAARTYRALLMVVRRPKSDETQGPLGVSRAEVLLELSEIARRQGDAERSAEHLDSAFEAARESEGERERLLDALRERGRHEVLARALEGRLAGELTLVERAAILDEIATLYEAHLGRPGDALGARLAGLDLAPPPAEALERALEAARKAEDVERYLAVHARLASAETDPDRAIDLALSLARALERDAHDDARAAAEYHRAEGLVEARGLPGDERREATWNALDEVYGRLGDGAAQEALLERRLGAAGDDTDPAHVADALYRLAGLRLRREGSEGDAVITLERAFDSSPDADRAEAMLREALARAPKSAPLAGALERLGRQTSRDRAVVDALVILAEADAAEGHGGAVAAALREAFELAERLEEAALVEKILRQAVQSSAAAGDAALGWALLRLADTATAGGNLREAADLKERAARAASPDQERELLLEVAALAKGPLGDLPRAAALYEELRAREPAEQEIWQPLVEVYRTSGDTARLIVVLDETAPLIEATEERSRLRLELARLLRESDEDRAIYLLQEVVEESPGQAEAAAELGSLLEKRGRKEDLAALVRRQLEAAKDREDKETIVALSLRLGALLEEAGDEQAALDAYHAALDWDAKNRAVLREVVRLGASREDSMALDDSLDQLLEIEVGEDAAVLALRLAQIRTAHGDAAGAERALEQGYEAAPTDDRLREELGARYTVSESWDKLAGLYAREAEARATPLEKARGLARAAEVLRTRAKDPEGAAALLVRALELAISEREILLSLIEAQSAAGAPDKAIEAISRVLAHHPDDPWLYRARAQLQEALGRGTAALGDLERAYEKSNGAYAAELVALLEKVRAAFSAQSTPEARGAERAIRIRLAEVLTRAGELAGARAELTELTRTDPKDRGALRALGTLEEAAGEWDAAAAVYRRLVSLEDGPSLVDSALRYANASEKCERLGDARGALERALRFAPGHPRLRDKLRAVYNTIGAGRELAAMIIEDAAHATDPAARFTHLVHAARLLLDAEGEGPRAAVVLEQARAMRPDDGEVSLLLADAYTASGRLGEARAILEASAAAAKGRRSKGLAGVYRRIARIGLAEGDNAGAVAALSRALDNDPQNAGLAMDLGALALDLEEVEVATRAFRTVTLMKVAAPGSPEGVTPPARALAYYHLGRMAFAQGDRRKARMMIDKALADDASLDDARDLLEQLRS